MPPYCSGTDNLIRQSRRVRCCTIWSSVRLAGFPDAVAIRRPDGDLTYRELDRLSSQIASALRRLGVAIGDRVGVWLGKSGRATELVARFM
ncbi:MAG: AMP-binding protein [Proteobacteria bacterium]|nr:AMP-binding protein [Pseudomonadota bacterium]